MKDTSDEEYSLILIGALHIMYGWCNQIKHCL